MRIGNWPPPCTVLRVDGRLGVEPVGTFLTTPSPPPCRPPPRHGIFSGVSAQELPQDVLQDAAVAVILHLLRRVEPHLGDEIALRAVGRYGAHRDRLAAGEPRSKPGGDALD